MSVGSDRRIWLYDGKTGEARKQIGDGEHTGSIFAVSWAKDSKSFVTASADQTVRIWDPEAGKCTHTWRMGGETVHVPSQQVGVVWPQGRSDGLIISVDLAGNLNYLTPGSTTPSKIVYAHQGSITAAGLSGSSLLTGSYDGRVRAWNISSGIASAIDGETHSNYVAGIAGTDTRMYSIGWDDTLRSIDPTAQTFIGSTSKISSQPKGLAVSKSGLAFVATAENIEVFGSDGTRLSQTPLKNAQATSITASPTDDLIAVGLSNNTAIIYKPSPDGKTLTETAVLKDTSLTSPPSTLTFSPQGTHLAIGTSAGRICVFTTSDWSLFTSRWSAHAARVTSISWSSSGEYAVSGSLDTNVQVWSVKEPGKRIKAGNAHKEGVNAVVWVGENRVVSAGADAAVRVWRVEGLK